MTALAPHLSAYLREHLPRERAVSPHTVKTYANCFVLLVQFAADRLKRRGRVRQGGVISAVAVGHRQAALAVMCRG